MLNTNWFTENWSKIESSKCFLKNDLIFVCKSCFETSFYKQQDPIFSTNKFWKNLERNHKIEHVKVGEIKQTS